MERVPSSSKTSAPTTTQGAVTSTSAKAIPTEQSDTKIIIRTQEVKEFEEVVKKFSEFVVTVPINLRNRTKKLEDEIITTYNRICKLEHGNVDSAPISDQRSPTAFPNEFGELKKVREDMKSCSEQIQANYSAFERIFTKVCSSSDAQKSAIDKINQDIQEVKESYKKKAESSSGSDSDSVSSPKPSPSIEDSPMRGT
jgi:hypothetical protein